MVFQPEAGMNERVILRSRGKLEPASPQAMKVAERRVVRDIVIVVPNVVEMPDLLISDDRECDQKESFEREERSMFHDLNIA